MVEPDNVADAVSFHEKRVRELGVMATMGFVNIAKFNAFSKSSSIIDAVELGVVESKMPPPCSIVGEPDSIAQALKFHQKRIGKLSEIQKMNIGSVSLHENYLASKRIVKRITSEIDDRKAKEAQLAAAAEEKRIEEEKGRRLWYEQERLRAANFFKEWKSYLERCLLREYGKIEPHRLDFYLNNESYLREFIKEVHVKHNEKLLKGKIFPGCWSIGLDRSDEKKECTWTYHDSRCSCGYFSGFRWSTKYVDWCNRAVFSIDSVERVGDQVRER
ncbi:MAG: hypothetical protein Hyperionvirus5_64 [Hyperionvirus sp.]|uniref:Uncharacterized protein n=1 Tax=Hyperionvirus sp. TaxID=2487770 RepID=A0A3G5A7V3_9VIRU|nr:MAG: hypothetical protein Hyperionvirus5_64 [Hyperionvirus sp.]